MGGAESTLTQFVGKKVETSQKKGLRDTQSLKEGPMLWIRSRDMKPMNRIEKQAKQNSVQGNSVLATME